MRPGRLAFVVCITLLCAVPARAGNGDGGHFSGFAAIETRVFPSSPEWSDQDRATVSPSIVLQPEYRHKFGRGRDVLTVVPFLRLDIDDDRRSHVDLRELNWRHRERDWDVLVGIGKVFWGVAESRHLVDIVNQTDQVENLDGEDKLGQPMVNLNVDQDWGTLSLFVLPGFRTRSFPESRARLRGSAVVETGDAVFESGAGRAHVDFAARWWHSMGDVDIGVAHFRGTGREPRLVEGVRGGNPVFIPHYDVINQTSLDAQYTRDGWLWKLEAISRSGQGRRFAAAVAGFEYTIHGAAGTRGDVGFLAEYLYDGRGREAPATSADDDIFAALRLVFNDAQSVEVLAGALVDRDTNSTLLSIEAARRLGDAWRLEFELRALINTPLGDPEFGGIRRDDHLLFRLSRYF